MQMPAEDSAMLIDSTQASTLGANEALLYDEDAGRLTTFRPYQLPPAELVAELGAMAATTGTADLVGRRATPRRAEPARPVRPGRPAHAVRPEFSGRGPG
jgi:hypothetical protein